MTDDRAVKCAEEIRKQIYDIWKKVRADFGIAGIQSLLEEQIIPATISKHFPTWIRIDGEGTLPERDDWYDIVLDDGRLGMGRFRDGNFDWLMFDNPRLEVDRKVTHWRNRPAPPSEGK